MSQLPWDDPESDPVADMEKWAEEARAQYGRRDQTSVWYTAQQVRLLDKYHPGWRDRVNRDYVKWQEPR